MEKDRDRRYALEGYVRYHDERIWKQTKELVKKEKASVIKMTATLIAIGMTAITITFSFLLHRFLRR